MEDLVDTTTNSSATLLCLRTGEKVLASSCGDGRLQPGNHLRLTKSTELPVQQQQRKSAGTRRRGPNDDRASFHDYSRSASSAQPAGGQQFMAPSWTVSRISSGSESSSLMDTLTESWMRYRTYFKGLRSLILSAPIVLLVPTLVLLVLLVAGELGLWAASRSHQSQMRLEAMTTARRAANQIQFILQSQQAPVVAFATLIKQTPNIIELNNQLEPFMATLLRQLDPSNNTLRFSLYPWGIRSGVYPPTTRNLATLNFNSMDSPLYRNGIRIGSARAIESIERGKDFSIVNGPFRLSDFDNGLSVVSFLWLPVYDNETLPASSNGNCNRTAAASITEYDDGTSGSSGGSWTDPWGFHRPFRAPYAPGITLGNLTDPVCRSCGSYCAPQRLRNGMLYRYWGYCESIVLTQQIDNVLKQLITDSEGAKYKYLLYRIRDTMLSNATQLADLNKDGAFQRDSADVRSLGLMIFGSSDDAPEAVLSPKAQPVCASMALEVLDLEWRLCIAPEGGWEAIWMNPLRAMVLLCALIVAVLDFAFMVSRERHRQLMKAMLPEKVIRRLTAGRTYAQPFSSVTILFSDIVSYTNLSAELTPQEVVDLLNMLYLKFDSLIDRHKLYKVETIGDAFMCVGGAPEPCHPRDAAIRVARMALDMIDCVHEFTAHASGRRIQIRVGMYTGDVVAAVMGKKMPHWCLVGDTVNVSSRMESSSKAMMVQVGSTTAELLRNCDEFHLTPRGAVDIKGKGRMITYWLRRANSDGVKLIDPAAASRGVDDNDPLVIMPGDGDGGGGGGGQGTTRTSGGSGGDGRRASRGKNARRTASSCAYGGKGENSRASGGGRGGEGRSHGASGCACGCVCHRDSPSKGGGGGNRRASGFACGGHCNYYNGGGGAPTLQQQIPRDAMFDEGTMKTPNDDLQERSRQRRSSRRQHYNHNINQQQQEQQHKPQEVAQQQAQSCQSEPPPQQQLLKYQQQQEQQQHGDDGEVPDGGGTSILLTAKAAAAALRSPSLSLPPGGGTVGMSLKPPLLPPPSAVEAATSSSPAAAMMVGSMMTMPTTTTTKDAMMMPQSMPLPEPALLAADAADADG